MRASLSYAVFCVLYSITAFADLGVIDDQDQKFVVFRTASPFPVPPDEVRLVKCEGDPVALTREHCRDAPLSFIAFADFIRNVNAIYGVPSGLGGQGSIERVSQAIEGLERDLSEGIFTAEEEKVLIERKGYFSRLQKRLIRINQIIYSKLTPGSHGTLDSYYGVDSAKGGDAERMKAAFDPVWFDGHARVWRLASAGGTYYEQMRLCKFPFRVSLPSDFKTMVGEMTTIRLMNQSVFADLNVSDNKDRRLFHQVSVWTADEMTRKNSNEAVTLVDMSNETIFTSISAQATSETHPILCVMELGERAKE